MLYHAGSYGRVYRGIYEGKPVAVKVGYPLTLYIMTCEQSLLSIMLGSSAMRYSLFQMSTFTADRSWHNNEEHSRAQNSMLHFNIA